LFWRGIASRSPFGAFLGQHPSHFGRFDGAELKDVGATHQA